MTKVIEKVKKGKFDFDDMAMQMKTISKFGGVGKLLNFIPGASELKSKLGPVQDEKKITRQHAIIQSMTKKERSKPDLLSSYSRKKRIARGAGVQVKEVNSLVSQHRQMSQFVGSIGSMSPGKLDQLSNMLFNKK